MPTVEKPVCMKPLYPTVLIPDTGITEIIRKDKGFKKVLTKITSSSSHYKSAIPVNVELQEMGSETTKYAVVLDINGKKEQKVYTYQGSTGQIVHYATTAVPTVIVPRRVVQTVIENKKVTVSNNVDQVEVFYPETKTIVEVLKNEIKDIKKVESVVVVPESGSTDATFITQGTSKKEFIVKQYSSKNTSVTNVDEQVVQIGEIVRPKPISIFPVTPEVLYEIPVLETEVKKVLKISKERKIEKTQIKSVKVSKNTNVPIYNV